MTAFSDATGRFAPSPTGPLHFGSLLAALASRCQAKAQSGRWLVRMEDIDEPRCKPEHASTILRTLESHALTWDGPVFFQSERLAIYREHLASLDARSLIYRCTCSRRELASLPRNAAGEVIYPGLCRHGARSPLAQQHSIRVRVPDEVLAFHDQRLGCQQENLARDAGDFVLLRADGFFAYHFVVVVDDALQGVTEVVRGADLLAATPRQEYLRKVLGFSPVTHLHIPIALSAQGEKLSKQTQAPALDDAQAAHSLVRALRALGQNPPDGLAEEAPSCIVAWATSAWDPRAIPVGVAS